MRTLTHAQRFLALALALVMLVGLLPVSARAADTVVDAAVIFSDLHTNKSDYKESTVKGIFGALKNTGLPFSSVTSAGDAFSVNEDSSSSNGPYTGDPTKITGYIRTALGSSTIPVNYVWSDHDRYATGIDKKSSLVEYDNYYIYKLSMGDLCSYDRYKAGFNYTQSSNSGRVNAGFTATVPQAIAEFEAAVADLDKSKPLFIVSHQPLFDNRNDNAWAEDWFDSINAVAEEMDVAFFFGHNHKYDTASDYYYAKGSTLPVATRDNWGWKYETGVGYKPSVNLSSRNKVLNFTHMCAGYMEPTSTGSYDSNTTRRGTVMAITIYDDAIRYTTYDKNGIYTGNYAVDKTVTRDHAATEPELVVSGTSAYFVGQELELAVGYKTGSKVEDVTALAVIEGYDMDAAGDYTVTISYEGLTAQFPIQVRQKTFTDAATGVCAQVQVPGATALTVGTVDESIIGRTEGMLSSARGYDIGLTGFGEGNAVITLPIPSGVDTPVVCHIAADGTILRVEAETSGDTVSFTTASFGIFLIGQEEITEALENSVIGGGTAYEEKTVYVKASAFENGGKYLIVGEDKATNGNKIAYVNNNGSEGWVVVTPNADGQIELDNAGAVWTASTGFTLSNNGRYIGGTDANTLKSSASGAAKVTYDAGASRLKTASGTVRYLYYSTYSSENWKWSTSSSSSTSSRNIWIYKQETVRVNVSTPVTYTLDAQALHHVLAEDSAQLRFALLADGQTAELPQGASWRFLVTNDRSGIIESISGDGVIAFTGEVGSCYVKICCDLDAGTVYKYVKVSTEADPNACDHVYTTQTVAATCTQDGLITYTCACGDSYTEVLPALGHSYTVTGTAPTCENDGFTTYTCHCGDTYTDIIPALGHAYASVVTAPTCTLGGFTTYTCACGDSYVSDRTAALGHSYEAVTDPATCTESGSATYTCACGDSYTEVLPALGHSYEAAVTAPTCENDGFTTYTCRCGDSYVADVVAALGHSHKAVVTAPTCENDGFTTYTCHCGNSYVADVVAALGHSHKAVVTAPTCENDGFTTYTCHCGNSYVADMVAALGHSYETVVTAPTCENDGFTTYTCHCGDSYVADVVAALGHSYESLVTAPTCENAGFTTHTCHCGYSYTSDNTAALGHSYTTVEQDGFLIHTCHCGHSYSEKLAFTYSQASAFTANGHFVITIKSGSKYYALSHKNNSITAVQVTVSGGEITSEVTEELLWTYEGGKLCYVSGGTTHFLYTYSSGWFGLTTTLGISTTESDNVSLSGTKLKIDSKYLRYSSSSFSVSSLAGTAYIFREE